MDSNLTLDDRVISALRRIVRAIDLHSCHLVECFSVTGPQLIALREMARLRQVPVGVLARNVHVSHPTMTGILDRLEKRGLVQRTRDTQDRRRMTVTPTPEGLKLLDDVPSSLQDRFQSEFCKLREWEQTQMLATLQRIAGMMDATALDAAPLLTTGATVATPVPPESVDEPEAQGIAAGRQTVGANDYSKG